MRNVIKLMAISAVASFASCVNDIDVTEENGADPNVISINAVHPSQNKTRVSSIGFDSNDKIGVFVSAEGSTLQAFGNSVNNGCFTYDGNKWNPEKTFYWNEGKHDVYAYYPYQTEVKDVEDLPFAVQKDQSTLEGYGASDFLWAKAENQQSSTTPVTLTFDHIMSRAIVELVKGDKYEGDIPENAEVYIHNTVTKASVDISTGSTGKDSYANTETIKMQKLATGKYAAIIVPQRIDTRRPLVEVIIGNISYLMEGTMSFKQGFQHTLTVTLASNPQQAEIEIGGGLGNWD